MCLGFLSISFLWPCIVSKVWRERKPTRCKNQMFIINMFRASLCPSSEEQRPCVTACGVLRWFCWLWLAAVVGRCVVGCEQCEGRTVTFTVLAPYNAAPHKRYRPPSTFSTNLSENFLILRSIQRDIFKNVYRSSSKVISFFFFYFNESWFFSTDCQNIL